MTTPSATDARGGTTPPYGASHAPLGFLRTLEGLRGVAILAVLVHHFWHYAPASAVGVVTGSGWAGVDLFFVLSGFLITRILLDLRRREATLRAFYVRRVLRIFPLYYAVVALLVLVLPALGAAPQQVAPGYLPAVLLYVQNYAPELALAQGGSLLAITWSLCVEEQFYLVWPALTQRVSLDALRRTAVASCGAALLIRIGFAIVRPDDDGVFRWLPARIDALMAGALIAFEALRDPELRRARRLTRPMMAVAASGLGALTLAQGRVYFRDVGTRTIGFTLVAALCAGLVVEALSANARSLYARGLSAAPLQVLGRYSYGLYLLHSLAAAAVHRALRPVLGGSSEHWSLLGHALYAACAFTASLVVAAISWHAFERPILALKGRLKAAA